MGKKIITEDDFFKRQTKYKNWFLNEKKSCNSHEAHCIEFRYFLDNIMYALYNTDSGIWTTIDYQKHMIKIAKQVVLSPKHIDEMQQKLDYDKEYLGIK